VTPTHACTPATFGTTGPDTTHTFAPQDFSHVYFSSEVLSSSGTLNDIQIYLATGAACSMQVAVYTADINRYPQTLVGVSAQQSVSKPSAGWVTFPIAGNAALNSGTYVLCLYVSSGSIPLVFQYQTDVVGGNWGVANLAGSDLTSTPTNPLHYSGNIDIFADYCQ
jgi:hypothetical protein